MTDVHGDLMDIAGFRGNGVVRVQSALTRPSTNEAALVTTGWHSFTIRDGLVELLNLDPGPANVHAEMGAWAQQWTVMIPDESDPITFTTLLDAYVEYDPAIVGQAQAARDAAVAARDAASGHAVTASTAAGDAQAAYAALTDDIENAADVIRGQVADDADRAETARDAAEDARAAAEDARDTAVPAAGTASTAAAAAATSAELASTARNEAVGAAEDAEDARDVAVTKAGEAAGSASSASSSATAAGSAAGDAATARSGAESARDDAVAAAGDAEDYRDTAVTKAGEAAGSASAAAGSASAADAAKTAAQAAASSFGLSAGTVTTGSPSSSAQVTVTNPGGGPAYVLSFTIPRGAQGIQGPQGTGLQLQDRVATYSALPGGLNGTTDKGKAYIVDADGLLYIWDGTAFPAQGSGLSIVGAKGDNGQTAYQVAVGEGFVGTAGEWLASLVGDPGKSAYEVAVDNGFVGSESAWLESLNGEDGADGATSWNDLDDKPATFPPITGTGAADAKPGNWQPTWANVSGKPSTFPPTIGAGATQAVAGNDPRLTDARTPTTHEHTIGQVTGLQPALDGKALKPAEDWRVYATGDGGAHSSLAYSANDATAWALVQRGNGGVVKCGDPAAALDAVNLWTYLRPPKATFTTIVSLPLNAGAVKVAQITGQVGPLTVLAPNNASDEMKIEYRIRDNGTARAITWNAVFLDGGPGLPATTTPGKTLRLGFVYDSSAVKWVLLAKAEY